MKLNVFVVGSAEIIDSSSMSPVVVLISIFLALTIGGLLISAWMDRRSRVLEQRKEQAKANLRENVIKRRMDELTEKHVKLSKRYEAESLMLQAGLKMDYSELMMASIASGIIFFVIGWFVFSSPLLAFILLVSGFLFPKQLISFLRNRRMAKLEEQVGIFIDMFVSRYDSTNDFKKAFQMTAIEFKGEEPIYRELQKASMDIDLGKPSAEVMEDLARRTGNMFMLRLSDFYKISSTIGTEVARRNLLQQVIVQFNEHKRFKNTMNRELSKVKRNAYSLLAVLPAFVIFQISADDSYVEFMTQTTMGQVGSAFVILVMLGSIWFINKKILAPLE